MSLRRSLANVPVLTLVATALLAIPATPAHAANVPGRLLVAGATSPTVTVVDTATDAVVATPALDSYVNDVVADPAHDVYYASDRFGDFVEAFNATTNTSLGRIRVGSEPDRMAVNAAGTRLYVANIGSGTISVIDTATHMVLAVVPVGGSPHGIVVPAQGGKAYVTNDSSISVVDTATNTVTATVNVGQYPEYAAVNPAGTLLYVPSNYANTVQVVSTATNTVTATIPVCAQPFSAAVTPNGAKVLVGCQSGALSVIDTATGTVTATRTGYGMLLDVAVDGTGQYAYLSDLLNDAVTMISLTTYNPVATIGVSRPGAIAFKAAPKPPTADLAVDIQAVAKPALLNSAIEYTLAVSDLGPDAATSAGITATLPAGTTATQLSTGCTQTGAVVTCAYGAIPSGTTASKTFRLPVGALTLGQVKVTATRATSAPTDPNPANDSDSATCNVVSILIITC
ncbi:MAG: YncE family protein [Streptomycetaceae bacterium]|nr:YncE family protein [Streptomycetaceae bacterium]